MNAVEYEQDVLLGNFQESYKHLSFKHILGLSWATSRCPRNATIIKMDDDIAVDIPKMIEKSGNSLETIGGWLHSKMNVRRRNSKWSLSKVEFEQDTFPDFVSGWAYAMTMSSAKRIVYLAETASNLWVDDVWVTGILRLNAGINQLNNWSRWYTPYIEHLKCCLEDLNYSCDFIVLPTNGDTDLIEKFGKLSRHCYNYSCFTRPQSISIRKICNVANPLFLPESGGVGHVLNAGG